MAWRDVFINASIHDNANPLDNLKVTILIESGTRGKSCAQPATYQANPFVFLKTQLTKLTWISKAAWSSGVILASGARGSGLNSQSSPLHYTLVGRCFSSINSLDLDFHVKWNAVFLA